MTIRRERSSAVIHLIHRIGTINGTDRIAAVAGAIIILREFIVENAGHFISSFGLDNHGLAGVKRAFWNLDAHHLFEEAVRRGEGRVSAGGAIVTETGQHTGRSPNDRFIVEEDATKGEIWWGNV
ncbi:MAG: phosphoenolpyruvate carboxykinase (ATP), partial [Rhodospirillales bacterium]